MIGFGILVIKTLLGIAGIAIALILAIVIFVILLMAFMHVMNLLAKEFAPFVQKILLKFRWTRKYAAHLPDVEGDVVMFLFMLIISYIAYFIYMHI